MATKYWEDYNVGDKFKTPGKTITEGAISIMVGLGGYIMPLFLDEEECKKGIFGTRIAPGRLTVFMMGGLEEQSDMWDEDSIIALVGLDKVRVKAPLRAGDTLRVEMEVTEKRETRKPDRGIIIHRSVCKNQKGEEVAETETAHMVKRRP
ncbi:MAG: dehydratase [Chloroflexi bacterium CG07_land_8_20_14_0_80_51_10]|nr:MAG: dehydratase [Chloroflexi bacterium CG07_land_8_20_14_0_80_51_10]